MKAAIRLFLLVTLACTALSDESPAIREKRDNNIREAVIRKHLDPNPWGVKVFFLQLENGADPSNQFMQRFAGHKPPVKKASGCKVDKDGVWDLATGDRGLLFRIIRVKWKSEIESEVEASYSQDAQVASDQIFTVRKRMGIWKVTAIKIY